MTSKKYRSNLRMPLSVSFGLLLIFIIFIFYIISSGMAWSHFNEQYIPNAKVTDKFIDVSSSGSGRDKTTVSHYVIVTDKGVFEVDRPLLDTFNSSRNADITYSKIKIGNTYNLRTYGYRFDFIYTYPIVVEAT